MMPGIVRTLARDLGHDRSPFCLVDDDLAARFRATLVG